MELRNKCCVVLLSCHSEETNLWAGVANGLPSHLPATPRHIVRIKIVGEGELLLAMAAEGSQVAVRPTAFST